MPWYNDLRPNNDEGKKDYSLVFPEMSDKEKKDAYKTYSRFARHWKQVFLSKKLIPIY